MTSDTESNRTAEDWFQLGLDRGRAGDDQGAIDAYGKAVEMDPSHFRAHFNMGIRYGKLLMNVKAVESFKKAIELRPEDAMAHYSLGLTSNLCGLTDESIHHYKEAIRLRSEFAEAYSNLATVYYQFKQGRDATENLLKAEKLFEQQGNTHMAANARSILQDLFKEFDLSQDDFPNI